MSDIVERLRRYSYRQGTGDEQGQLIHELVRDMHEAADEIERLNKEVDNLIEMLRREKVWILAAQGRKEALEEIANE